MASVWEELKRRNVVKVAVAYAIVAWLLIQVVGTVFPMFNFPNWSSQLITIVILFGFPIAVIFARAFELTPEGVKKTETSTIVNLFDQTKKSAAPVLHQTIKFKEEVFGFINNSD